VATITLENLTKYFGNSTAVDHINLEVASGELIALLGPSGCGKTTTLQMLAGFLSPDAGQILVDGKVLSSKQRTIPPERRNMAMIFQSYAIWPHKTVFENVAFGLHLRHIGKEKLRTRVMRALEVTHLSRLANRYPAQLSGGQQQRVALARAIVIEPQTLLLDEPLSNLDANLRDEMRSEVRRIHDETGLTTVFVTHDQSEALVLADRIVVMSDGLLQQTGTPEEIYESPATEFVARFIGRCNVLPGILLPSGQIDIGGILILAEDHPPDLGVGCEVALCIRPQSIIMEPIYCPTDISNINCFTALVERHNYFGEFREYQVYVENTSLRLNVVTSPTVRHQLGDRMYLRIPQEHCRVVPRSGINNQVNQAVLAATS